MTPHDVEKLKKKGNVLRVDKRQKRNALPWFIPIAQLRCNWLPSSLLYGTLVGYHIQRMADNFPRQSYCKENSDNANCNSANCHDPNCHSHPIGGTGGANRFRNLDHFVESRGRSCRTTLPCQALFGGFKINASISVRFADVVHICSIAVQMHIVAASSIDETRCCPHADTPTVPTICADVRIPLPPC